MTHYDKDKKTRILNAAAELFADKPFHKVLLSDVARAAAVGKGTLYLYFKSKDDLYLAVLFRGFSRLVDKLKKQVERNDAPADSQMKAVVEELFNHLYDNAVFFELLRGAIVNCPNDGEWNEKRIEMRSIIETVIRNGVAQGIFADDLPQLSSLYIPGIIRSVSLFPPEGVGREAILEHAKQFVLRSLQKH